MPAASDEPPTASGCGVELEPLSPPRPRRRHGRTGLRTPHRRSPGQVPSLCPIRACHRWKITRERRVGNQTGRVCLSPAFSCRRQTVLHKEALALIIAPRDAPSTLMVRRRHVVGRLRVSEAWGPGTLRHCLHPICALTRRLLCRSQMHRVWRRLKG